MLTFHIVEVAAELFSDDLLANFAGDLFEILGCYFPIHFTHVSVILYQPYSILSFDRIVFDFGMAYAISNSLNTTRREFYLVNHT